MHTGERRNTEKESNLLTLEAIERVLKYQRAFFLGAVDKW